MSDPASYSYFDDLRRNNASNFSPILKDVIGRNLHRYHNKTNSSEVPDENDIIFCHTPVFVRYTTQEKEDYSGAGYGGAAGAMLAIQHWNNGNGVVVKDIEAIQKSCPRPIKFTTEIFDTESNAVPAVRGLTGMIIRDPYDIDRPQPCAIVGTIYSSVSTKFAITTGVYDLLQVAPGASSDALDDKKQYPLFSRTHPADEGSASLLPKYLQDQLQVKNFAIVFVHTDGFGASYHKSVLQYAKQHGMNVLSVPITFYPEPTKQEIMEELKTLVDSKLNYIIGVFFFNNFEPIMEAAVELGVAGPGKLWFFAGSLSDRIYEQSITYERDSPMHTAMFGNAIITDGGAAEGTPQYTNFLKEWMKMGDDPNFLSYVNSKQPVSATSELNADGEVIMHDFSRNADYFHKEPVSHIAIYSYEAIIGIGIAACEASRKANSSFVDNDVFSGSEHHAEFLNIDFLSASGEVVIGSKNPADGSRNQDSTFSRNETSTYFVVANILETEAQYDMSASAYKKITLQGQNHIYFDALSGDWKSFTTTRKFEYADKSFIKPFQIPQEDENMNLIKLGIRTYCFTLSLLAITASIGFLVYTIRMRNARYIKLAQPPFLVMICVGTFLMASAIFPFSIDEGITENQMVLDASCSMSAWLFSLGLTITFAALFSKLWRANQIQGAGFRRVKVQISDVLKPLFILLISNTSILSVWQVIGALKWERKDIAMTAFDQVTESEGYCNSENGMWYVSALIFVNGVALMLACHQAYLGRKFKTELNESKFIGVAMLCIFQSFFFGVPLIFISASDQQTTYLVVATSICFVICIATLLFIFLPKILKQREIDSPSLAGRREVSVSGLPQSTIELRRTLRNTNTSLSVSVLGQSVANPDYGNASNFRSSLYRSLRTSDVFPNLRESGISTSATQAPSEKRNSTSSNAIRSFNSQGRISSITEEVDYSPRRCSAHESAVVDTSFDEREENNGSIEVVNPNDLATPIPLFAHNDKCITNSTRDEQSRQSVSLLLPSSTDIESVLKISQGNLARPESFQKSYLSSQLSEEFLPNGANDSNENTYGGVELNSSSSGNFEDEMTESDNLIINAPPSPTFSTSNNDNSGASQFLLEDEVKTESSSSDSDSKMDEVV